MRKAGSGSGWIEWKIQQAQEVCPRTKFYHGKHIIKLVPLFSLFLYQLYIQPPSTPSFYSFVRHSFLVFFVTFIFVSSKGYSSSYLFGSIKVLCGSVIKDWIRCAPPPRFFKEKTSGAAATAAPVESSITWFEMQPSNRFPQTLRYRTKKKEKLIEHTVNLGSLTTCFFNSIS